ncbi:MAG: inositol-3-phosphate synthase [Alphaproteobacteria bacterium]|nr:inositol-3-phosphate synthase [Alphaproteobacteria bacterium]
MTSPRVRIAVAGVGNCASALIQGIEYYRALNDLRSAGLINSEIAGITAGDIDVVAAFDVDIRKVGKPVNEAIFAAPNCAQRLVEDMPGESITVEMGPVLDGIAPHMAEQPDDRAFRQADAAPVDIAQSLKNSGAEVLVCYLPVGSDEAVKHYAQACLDAGVALVNCVPVFLASDAAWADKFRDAGLPIIGDDIKSQLGATIVHRVLTQLFNERGVDLQQTYQLNTGGNTDFMNMRAEDRLKSKRISKTQSVQSANDQPMTDDNIHIGPSDYVAWQKDNKVCFIRMQGQGFGQSPVELELRLSVEDSPNSAGSVIDAIRFAKAGLMQGWAGPLEEPSAYYMKSPARQIPDAEAFQLCKTLVDELAG